MNFIFGESRHIAGNFITVFQILDIYFRYCYIIFINGGNIIKEMIQNAVTKQTIKRNHATHNQRPLSFIFHVMFRCPGTFPVSLSGSLPS